jgi:hypothetical protein
LDGGGWGALGLRRSWEQKNAKRKQQDWASVGPTGGVWTRRRCGREGEERRRHVVTLTRAGNCFFPFFVRCDGRVCNEINVFERFFHLKFQKKKKAPYWLFLVWLCGADLEMNA